MSSLGVTVVGDVLLREVFKFIFVDEVFEFELLHEVKNQVGSAVYEVRLGQLLVLGT